MQNEMREKWIDPEYFAVAESPLGNLIVIGLISL
jgi:hypothetical protein